MLKKLVLGLFFGFIFLILAFKDVDFTRIFHLWQAINSLWLLPALGIFILGLGAKTIRWQKLLDSPQLKFITVFSALNVGYLVNNLLPARLGEVARIYLIGRKKNIGLAKTTATVILEKILDILTLLIMFFMLLAFSPFLRNFTKPLFLGITFPDKWQQKLKLFLSSFKILKNRKTLFFLLSLSLLIWLLETFWNYFLLLSFNLRLPISASFFLTVIVNLGFIIPAPPGYLGVFDFLVTFSLLAFGVDKSVALSYALFQHSLEYLLLTGLGIVSAINLSFNPFKMSYLAKLTNKITPGEKDRREE